jgi:ParB-like chromosome segregation protein Spo0J
MPEHDSLAVTWRPRNEIRPYPGNPRTITPAAVGKVADSIREYGWRQPIVVDEADEIIIGHTRWLAAGALGHEVVPVHTARGLTPEQVRALRLADNRTHDEAQWNLAALELELKALDLEGFDLALTAFDPSQWPREPDFEPASSPTSKPLDRLSEFHCPSCGHVFEAGARR